MDHSKLECATEVFIKNNVKPLGVDLEVPIYLKIDRIDIRKQGIFIIDYKTGVGDPNPFLLGIEGYLPQMIFYKWGVEEEYGQKINKAYLSLPGAYSLSHRYEEMNVNSLVEQSKVIEKVYHHLENIRNTRNNLKFEEKRMRYCNSCQLKHVCYTYINSMNLDSNKIKSEIKIHLEYELSKDS